MYRRPKFLEELDEIRVEMSRDADSDMEIFAAMIRTGKKPRKIAKKKSLNDSSIEKVNSRETFRGKKPIEKVVK